jgi:hypothetical protein
VREVAAEVSDMAKKSAKKVAKKAGTGSGGKKTGKKAAVRKNVKKSARGGAKGGPKAVSTGKGLTAAELGAALVAHVNSGGEDMELWKKHFHPRFVSIEGSGQAWTGYKGVDAKCKAWVSENKIHGSKASGPFVGATGFSVVYDMDVENLKSGQRFAMREVGVYTVKNGKVIQEEFMYGGM